MQPWAIAAAFGALDARALHAAALAAPDEQVHVAVAAHAA